MATVLDGIDTEHSISADFPLESTAQTIPENPTGSHKEENLDSTSKGHSAEASGGDVVGGPCGGCGSSCLGGGR